jgi:CDP-diacylglycerol--glycerol-3-phosphate 3-phosphatidyltransferase
MGYAVAKACARVRVKPGAVTALGLLACALVPVLAGRGKTWALLAAALVIVAAVADTVDGALAVLTSHTTRLGYVYDSVVDRLGEALWLLALWRLGAPGYLVVAAGAISWLHEYTRSRANAAGMSEIGAATMGERPTRVILAVIGLAVAGLTGLGSVDLPAGVATFAVAAWIILGVLGFAQLFSSVHRALAGRDWRTFTPAPPTVAPAFAGPIDAPASSSADDIELERIIAMPATTAVYTSSSAAAVDNDVHESDEEGPA